MIAGWRTRSVLFKHEINTHWILHSRPCNPNRCRRNRFVVYPRPTAWASRRVYKRRVFHSRAIWPSPSGDEIGWSSAPCPGTFQCRSHIDPVAVQELCWRAPEARRCCSSPVLWIFHGTPLESRRYGTSKSPSPSIRSSTWWKYRKSGYRRPAPCKYSLLEITMRATINLLAKFYYEILLHTLWENDATWISLGSFIPLNFLRGGSFHAWQSVSA